MTQPPTEISTARARGCITVDWEDFGQLLCWYHFKTIPAPRADIDRQTECVLELLGEAGVHATFFVLGMLAKHRPDLVRRIHADGHEIAVHGTQHIHLTKLSRDETRRDIEDSIKIVSDIIGGPVHGFRAPAFSVTEQNLEVLDLLSDLGLSYDSSIFPKKLPRYGIDGFDPDPRHYQLPGGGRIVELPLTVVPWAGRLWPVSGGGYVRLLPEPLLGPIVGRLRKLRRPFIFYTHPYEFDTSPIDIGSNFPEGHSFPAFKRFALNLKWNLFRKSFARKARRLLKEMSFVTCQELADDIKRNQCTRLLG